MMRDCYASTNEFSRSVMIDADIFLMSRCQRSLVEPDASTDCNELQFLPMFRVPCVPKDDCFILSSTTCRVIATGSPHTIGNIFLAFLDSKKVDATVLKVRPRKHWVSAMIRLDSGSIQVKARIYEEAEGHYLLELQRRSGCVVAFAKVYSIQVKARIY